MEDQDRLALAWAKEDIAIKKRLLDAAIKSANVALQRQRDFEKDLAEAKAKYDDLADLAASAR